MILLVVHDATYPTLAADGLVAKPSYPPIGTVPTNRRAAVEVSLSRQLVAEGEASSSQIAITRRDSHKRTDSV